MKFNTPNLKNSYQRRNFANPTLQAILFSIVVVIFTWFIVMPKLLTVTAARGELNKIQDQLKKTKSDELELNKLLTKLRASEDEVALVDEALPLTGRVSKANVLMENLVQTSGMSMSQLSSTDSQKIISAGDKSNLSDPFAKKRALYTITMTASVTGSMDQFRNLLELIETNSRVLDVDSMEIIGADQQIKFRVIVKAYAYESVIEGVRNAN